MTLEQAGYGRTETGSSNGRFFVAEPLDGFENNGATLVVNGMGERGVCYGDSGGPSLRMSPAGDVRVVGELEWGDESCVGRDRYTRVDTIRSWIEEWTGPTAGAGPVPCGSMTTEGVCNPDGNAVRFCAGDVLAYQACESGSSCGWSAGDNGWRCIPLAANPCAGATEHGRCDGQSLQWCERGGIARARDCQACGERCVLVNGDFGYGCVTSNCGDVNYRGQCQGDVAQWCNTSGQLQTSDCAEQERHCGVVSRETGYFCLSRRCGDLDFLGRCDGNIARWCQQGSPQERNCAAMGEVCRLVSEEDGYFCAPP